jgi:hypothetical protein
MVFCTEHIDVLCITKISLGLDFEAFFLYAHSKSLDRLSLEPGNDHS